MFERFSEEASHAVYRAHNQAKSCRRKCDVLDLLEEVLAQPGTAAGRLRDECGLDSETLVRDVGNLRNRGSLRSKAAGVGRAVEAATELCRKRQDRNVTTAHLLAGALTVVESLGMVLPGGLLDQLREGLAGVADAEPAAAGPGDASRHRQMDVPDRGWARTHLSATAYRVLQTATTSAVERNGGIIEREHIAMALENLQPSRQGS